MLFPAPEWPRAVRVLLYFRASDTGRAAAPRPLRSDPKNLNGGKDDGNYHQLLWTGCVRFGGGLRISHLGRPQDGEPCPRTTAALGRALCTDTQRERFLLYALHDFSYAEIAEICGCSKYAIRDSIAAVRKIFQTFSESDLTIGPLSGYQVRGICSITGRDKQFRLFVPLAISRRSL